MTKFKSKAHKRVIPGQKFNFTMQLELYVEQPLASLEEPLEEPIEVEPTDREKLQTNKKHNS